MVMASSPVQLVVEVMNNSAAQMAENKPNNGPHHILNGRIHGNHDAIATDAEARV